MSHLETDIEDLNPTPDTADTESIQAFVTDRTDWTDGRRQEVIDTRITVLQYLRDRANGKDERIPTRCLFEICQDRDATVTNQTVDPEASELNQMLC